MLYKRKKPLFMKKRFWIIISVIMVLSYAVYCFEQKAAAFGKSYLPNFAQRITTEALCDAVGKKLKEINLGYDDLASIKYDDEGNVRSIETNSANINLIKAEITKTAQDEIVKIRHSAMYVPLGAFTGLTLISNRGPEIKLTFCLTGSFESRVESSFESAGINQTVHHIRLIVTSKIVTASVDYDREITFDTDFELAQSVIAGQIPTTYGGYCAPIEPKKSKY